VKLTVMWEAESAATALVTLTDITTDEIGEFVTAHAFFVNRRTQRNETRSWQGRRADLKFAKNARNN